MKPFGLLLVLAGLVVVSAPVLAQSTAVTVYANLDGGNYVWEDAQGNNNPALAVTPGQPITLTLVSKDGFHNGVVGSSKSVDFDSDDSTPDPTETTLTFTAGAEGGTAELKCDYHTTMMSTIHFGAAPAGGEKNDSPGLALVGVTLALVGVALLVRRK